jgi:uncharacterized membrane protein YcaP (DUF421 family)
MRGSTADAYLVVGVRPGRGIALPECGAEPPRGLLHRGGDDVWFNSWGELIDLVVKGVILFTVLLAGVRLIGNRALSTMNASDFIITVAVGSTFATTMLSRSVSVAAGVVAIATLLGLQILTVRLSVTLPRLRRAAKGAPVVLLRDGQPIAERLTEQHVSEAELRKSVREHGYGGLAELEIVVLEADGSFSVVPKQSAGDRSAIPS